MRAWIVVTGEPIVLKGEARSLRGGMLAEALAEKGHDVVWWASNFDHATKRKLADRTIRLTPRAQVELVLLDGPSYARNVSLARVRNHRAVARRFLEDAERESKPDIILAALPTLELCDAAVHFGAYLGVPVVIDVRDKWPDLYVHAFPSLMRPLARGMLAWEFYCARRIFRRATAITAVSDDFLTWALGYARRARSALDAVFPLGYRANLPKGDGGGMRAKLQIPDERMIASFVGTFGASYDLDTLVEAARILERQRIPLTLVLAGTGDKAESLRARAGGLSTIVFAGWLDAPEIRGLLAASSVGIAPYVAGALQSLPNKPFEYMSAGLPIVSSLEGELERLITTERIGIHYQPGNAAALVDALNWTATHKEERDAMGSRARELLERRFSAEAVYRDLTGHLERIAALALPSSSAIGRPT